MLVTQVFFKQKINEKRGKKKEKVQKSLKAADDFTF